MTIQKFARTDRFETFLSLSVEMSQSGHLHHRSAFETDDTCGNCDGGNCDLCHPIWTVTLEMMLPSELTGEFWDELKPIETRTFENRAEALDWYNWLALKWISKKEGSC